MKIILNLLIRIIILDIIVLGLVHLITMNKNIIFRSKLEIAGIGLLIIAAGSFLGGRSNAMALMSFNQRWQRAGGSRSSINEARSIRSNFGLFPTAGIGGIILLLITIFLK